MAAEAAPSSYARKTLSLARTMSYRKGRRKKEEHNARWAANTLFTSILAARQLAHGEAPSDDSPICSPGSLKRRRGIAGASETPPLARRCRVDMKESVTIYAGYPCLPWDVWMKAQRSAATRQSNFNAGGLAHMNTGLDPIIHCRLYDDYDETPSPGTKRGRSNVGCRKVSVESWNPSPCKEMQVSHRQRREPRQYPRAIPLPTYQHRKYVNSGVVPSGSKRTSIDVPDLVPKSTLPRDSTLLVCSQMVATLKQASAHICEIQEQERTTLMAATCQESTRKQPSQFKSGPAMTTDDEPSIRAGGADITIPSAPSAIVDLGHSFATVPTLDVQICVPSLAAQDAETFAATRLNDDIRNNDSPDFPIVGHTSVISDARSMLADGISTQPPMDVVPANKRNPYQPPIEFDLSTFDDIEANAMTDTCVSTGDLFSDHDIIFECAHEDYRGIFLSGLEQRSDAPGEVNSPDNRCATSPRVGLGENGTNDEAILFTRDDISWATIPSFEVVSSTQPVGSPELFSNREAIFEFASEDYCSSFSLSSEQRSDVPGGVKSSDTQIATLPRVVLSKIGDSNNDGPVVFTRDASSLARVPSSDEVFPKESLGSPPSPRVSFVRQPVDNSFSFKSMLESLAPNTKFLSYGEMLKLQHSLAVESFPLPCSDVPANEDLTVDQGASASGAINFTASESKYSACYAPPVVDADSVTSYADLTLVIEGSKSPIATPAKAMYPLSESTPDNVNAIHNALLEADVTLVGQDIAQADDVPEVHTKDQAA
ncbi:hypothetical protein DFH29DRAFT_874738 [Suillus ampliporus]|nr:hypothetical protein DFH29DRAFT_874738 [Suillus ampliporus]